jgi:hemoglobin-like flavoprotein
MDIRDSVAFILGHKQTVIARFYERFLSDHPEVRPYFAGIDLRQQALMLTMALVVVEGYYSGGYPATEHYLHVLGHRHHLAGVQREHYPLFRDSLLRTLAEIHKERWDEELARQWSEAIDRAIERMLEGYERPYVY